MDTAERLERAMERAGLTQKALAERLDVHPKTVGYWVQGKYSPGRYRSRLIEVLGEDVMADDTDSSPAGEPTLRGASDAEFVAEMARRLTASRGTTGSSGGQPFGVRGVRSAPEPADEQAE